MSPYSINRLAQDFGRDGHSTFNQKCRSIWYRIFGNESLVEITLIATNSHCPTLNTDFYRLNSLPSNAKRKLANPCKWIELFIVSIPETLKWIFQRSFFRFREMFLESCGVTRDMSAEFSKGVKSSLQMCWEKRPWFTGILGPLLGIYCVLAAIITVLLHAVNELSLSFRCFLAPVRHIIRPSIELYQENAQGFWIAVAIPTILCLGLFIAMTISSGGLNLVIAGIAIAALQSTQICLIIATTLIAWVAVLRCIDAYAILKTLISGPSRRDQVVQQYLLPGEPGTQNSVTPPSTVKITEMLHGLNGNLAEIRPATQDSFSYDLALFTGTEAIFYPHKAGIPVESAQVRQIPFPNMREFGRIRQGKQIDGDSPALTEFFAKIQQHPEVGNGQEVQSNLAATDRTIPTKSQ